MKTLLLLSLLILQTTLTTEVLAANPLVSSGKTFKVLPGSATQELIDRAVEITFNSPMRKDLCSVYQHPYILSYSVGITVGTAERIYRSCPPNKNPTLTMPKIFQKQYFLVKDPKNSQKIQSWTSQDNKTFIFLDPDMDFEDFKNVIAHELAISLDAKTNMMLTTYYVFQNMNSRDVGNMRIISLPSNLSKNDELLRQAFNASTYHTISLTFATLRALNFESLVEGKPLEDLLADHTTCSRHFYDVFKIFQDNPEQFKENANSIYGELGNVLSMSNTPENVYKTLNFLLSPSLKLPASGNITFCQYMATPLLSNKSVWSFSANGPRPRVGGGWEPKKDQREKLERIFQDEIKTKKLIQVDPKSLDLNLESLILGGK